MLVVDAAAVIQGCLSETALGDYANEALVAPHLMWSEASSVLHELRWRGEISSDLAALAFDRLRAASISPRQPASLLPEAWAVADRLGWARTYDAEYVALARLLRCRLLTTDEKLRRRASALVEIVGPSEV